MKTKVSPATVGMFVLGAIVIGLIALFSFGSFNFFGQPQKFVVYFDETIHGLDLGSPVKLRGVRVGRVTGISLQYDAAQNKSQVAVICELSRNMIVDPKGDMLDVSDRAMLEDMIDRGLRAQLGVLGLATGLLYVELDFYDTKQYPSVRDSVEARYAVVPAVPSAISEFQANLTEILNDVKRIDFEGLAREAQGLLKDTRKQVNALKTEQLVDEWTKTGVAARALLESDEVKGTLANINQASLRLDKVFEKLDGKIDPTAEQLASTLKEAQDAMASFKQAADTAKKFVAAQQGIGYEATQAFARLSEAAEAVQRLADYLERNPSALISGRQLPEE